MSAERRLAKLEDSLTPTQAVLRWLDEAHAAGSLSAYIERTLAAPQFPTPLDLVVQAARTGAREIHKGRPSEAIETGVVSAARQAIFRFQLALRLNEIASEEARFRMVAGSATFFWMRVLISDDVVQDALTDPAQPTPWHTWHEAVRANLHAVYTEDEARVNLEREYFDGHPVLFGDVAEGWTETVEYVERVARFAVFFEELNGSDPPTSMREVDLSAYRLEAAPDSAKRAHYLADMGRARVLDMSHEEDRALAIMARHHGVRVDDPAA